MIVADASAVLELLSRDEPEASLALLRDQPVAAPDLLDVEVCSALRRLERERIISGDRGEQALSDLELLPVLRYPSRTLVGRAWEMRDNLTVYDGVYIALAERLAARLVTRDHRMARAARALGVALA